MQSQLLQVAFAGHLRPHDLGDPAEAAIGLTRAFTLLRDSGVRTAGLITGLAGGADHIAVKAWDELSLGPIHAVRPFLAEQADAANNSLAASITFLDGATLEASGRNPHLVQTRWLIDAADLLVVVWTGEAGRGAGGTADAVWLALERNIPVLWVKAGEVTAPRLIRPEHLDDDFGFLEFLEQLKLDTAPLVAEATADLLDTALRPAEHETPEDPALAPTVRSGLMGAVDRLMQRTLWQSYAVFRRTIGGKGKPGAPQPDTPADLAVEPGFAVFTAAYEAADSQANQLSAAHRSQQLLLLALAILMAAVGSAPSVWPGLKFYCVLGELSLALIALGVWIAGARASRHERWGRARRLAEQIRLERASWALGVSTVSDRSSGMMGPASHAARAVRRQAGLARGVYDGDRIARWGGWVMSELVGGQADYHHRQGHINETVSHRIHRVENVALGAFILALTSFALAYGLQDPLHYHLPPWLGGSVMMMGAIVPAFGAASLALEATLGFGEQGHRSLVLSHKLQAIAAQLGDRPRLDELQRAAKAAIRLLVWQEDRWTDEAVRRRLLRGG